MNSKNKVLRRNYMELAGMLKKAKNGTQVKLERIVSKMAMQEGLREARIWEYIELFRKARLLSFTQGHKKWKYHPESEWELFNINV